MQPAISPGFGTALSTITLTISVIPVISPSLRCTAVLGLSPAGITVLTPTFGVSILTFGSGRTNPMRGQGHLLMFLAYGVPFFAP